MKKSSLLLVISLIIGTVGYFYKKHSEDAVSCEVITELSVYGFPHTPVYTNSNRIPSQISIFTSSPFILSTIKNYKLDELYEVDSETLAISIKKDIIAQRVDHSMSIKIKVSSDSKAKSGQIAYALVHHYADYQKSRKLARFEDARSRLKSKEIEQKQLVIELRETFSKLIKYKSICNWHSTEIKYTPEEKIRLSKMNFSETKESYDEAVKLLEVIQSLTPKPPEVISPFVIHQADWIEETVKTMETRKLTK